MDLEPARRSFLAADQQRLCVELGTLFAHDPEFHRLEELVAYALKGGAMPADVQESTRRFLESVERAATHGSRKVLTQPGRLQLPKAFDFIADLAGAEGWTIAQALNRFVLDRRVPSRVAAVVGTMRNDGIYIMEWVAHYLALGFEHLFVYTNDNADSSDALLAELARHGIVTVIESEITGEVPPEAKAFGHALHLLHELRDYEWALCVDSDEYWIPGNKYGNSVHEVLSSVDCKHPGRRVGGICYDWLWFISDMAFERGPGLLCERFQHARPHWLSKCLVRIRDVQSMRQQHYPELMPDRWLVDSVFERLDVAAMWDRRSAQYVGGRVNHYWPRSFQEFAIKKARGAALGAAMSAYDRGFELFFLWNGYASRDNLYPTDPQLLVSVKNCIGQLRALDGVAAAADKIEREFPDFLARVAGPARLRKEYARHKTEPGDL